MDLATATAALPDTADDAAENTASDLMPPPSAAAPAPAAAAPSDAAVMPAAAIESPEQQALEAATKASAICKRQLQRVVTIVASIAMCSLYY